MTNQIAWFMTHASHQVDKQLSDANKDKESVIKKLAVLQEEHRNQIDRITDKEARIKELTKVPIILTWGGGGRGDLTCT